MIIDGENIDIQSIRTFVLAANQSSFTRAAEQLRYTRSTVTMQIQRLQEELVFPLFARIDSNDPKPKDNFAKKHHFPLVVGDQKRYTDSNQSGGVSLWLKKRPSPPSSCICFVC